MKTILVTGGAGFIGTHLCRALRGAGHRVKVLDVKAAAEPVGGVEYTRGDIRDPSAVKSAVDGTQAVYHLAALVSVPLCQQQPVESYDVNLLGTVRVLDEVLKKGSSSPRLFFASSAAVYGHAGQEGKAISEDVPLPSPLSNYGAQKLAGEHALRVAANLHGVQTLSFRFFNVFGPGQDPSSPYSGVISLFASAAREGRAVTLHGDGSQTRDFVSVHDLVRALVLALDLPASSCDGKPVNLGSGHATSVRKLADEIQKISSLKFASGPAREGDVKHSLADISRAENLLRWQPTEIFSDGLKSLLS